MNYSGKHREPAYDYDTGQDDSYPQAEDMRTSAIDGVLQELLVTNEALAKTISVLENRLSSVLNASANPPTDNDKALAKPVPSSHSDLVIRIGAIGSLTRESNDRLLVLMEHLDI